MVTRQLVLLRHAKSSWTDPELADHDRPLAPRGQRDARRIATYVQDHDLAPALVLCSSAVRTRETLAPIVLVLVGSRVRVEAALYEGTGEQLLARLRRVPDSVPSVLVIAHNPGLQQLCLTLAASGAVGLRPRVEAKFPTGALATLTIPMTSWRGLGPGMATLTAFVTPKQLG